MLRKQYWLAVAAASVLGSGANAQVAAKTDQEAALFGVLESATGLHLSPSGTFVSYVAHTAGDAGIR